MNRVKSPSVAAAEIWAKARTWVVRFDAIVLTLYLTSVVVSYGIGSNNLRDLLPCSFDIADFGLYSQFTLSTHFSGYSSDLSGEDRQLVNHVIDGINQIQDLSRNLDTDHLLGQVTTSDCGLLDQLAIRQSRRSQLTVAWAMVRTCSVKLAAMILTQSVKS
jgi:hypothetical protein